MGKDASQLIDYHATRAIEEFDKASQAAEDSVRRSHRELSRLHLNQASWLRSGNPTTAFSGWAK